MIDVVLTLLLYTRYVVWSQDIPTYSVVWNFTNKYGAPSFWLHPDSMAYFKVTILIKNATGQIEFGSYIRNESGTLIRKTPPHREFHPNDSHIPYIGGPFTVEELRAAGEYYVINVSITRPLLGLSPYWIFMPYILCLDEEADCQGRPLSDCREDAFCFRNLHRCMPFDEPVATDYCTIHERLVPHRVCDVRGTAYNSLCHVYHSPYDTQTFHSILMMESEFGCRGIQVFFKGSSSNLAIFPGSYHPRSRALTVGCKADDVLILAQVKAQVEERLEGGTVVFRKNFSCDSPIRLINPKSSFSVTYLSVVYLTTGTMSYVNLVNMMFDQTNIKVSLCKNTLTCILQANVSGPFKSKFLLMKYKDRHDPEQRVNYNQKTEQAWNLTEIGFYVCRVRARFRGCAPITTFQHSVDKTINVQSLIGKCSELIDVIDLPTEHTGRRMEIIITSLVVVVIIVFIIATSYLIFRKMVYKKIGQREKVIADEETTPAKQWPYDRLATLKLSAKDISSASGKRHSRKSIVSLGKVGSRKSAALFSAISTIESKSSSKSRKSKVFQSKKSKAVQSKKPKAVQSKKSKSVHSKKSKAAQSKKVEAAEIKTAKAVEIKKAKIRSPKEEKDKRRKSSPRSREKRQSPPKHKKVVVISPSESTSKTSSTVGSDRAEKKVTKKTIF